MLFDIIFISYSESNADSNYRALRSRFPYAKRLHGVTGIHQAHKQAAQLSFTEKFWVVDGDSQVEDTFSFKEPKNLRNDAVYVCRSRNAVNGLEYGYGGIKLLPKRATIDVDVSATDMTTSISENFFIIDEVASTTCFNSDPFSTWRSAFRECVKLSSRLIDNQINEDSEYRLNIWCTVGQDKPYGKYSIAGARAGTEYGLQNKHDVTALNLINDFSWLKAKFNKENK
jgi:hypothetical protein